MNDVSINTWELAQNLSQPLLAYGGAQEISIHYISDIHLDSKVRSIGDIRKLARQLDLYSYGITLILGDTASNPDLAVKFYHEIYLRLKHAGYVDTKEGHAQEESDRCQLESLQGRLERLQLQIDRFISKLPKRVRYSTIEKYRAEYGSYASAIDSYIEDHVVKEDVQRRLYTLAEMCDARDRYLRRIESLRTKYRYSCTPHYVDMYVVLGNHECEPFNSVEDAVTFYTDHLSPMGIKVLHNDIVVTDKYVLYGGIGFAKYNPIYNAATLVGCHTREEEIKQTDLFATGYYEARQYALDHNLAFICASHYPAQDCLQHGYDAKAIMFSGHTHHDLFTKSETATVYADNQIGYDRTEFNFRTTYIGMVRNPFVELTDGCHEITIEDYLTFNRYCSERTTDGAGLRRCCGKLFCIKSNGYYGFFIQNKSSIMLVKGCATKKVIERHDMDWIIASFDKLLNKYLSLLAPMYKYQKQISDRLKKVGCNGRIHGCIVDIDYYNHVMVNPVTLQIQCYYSPEFGLIKKIDTVPALADLAMEHNPLLESTTSVVEGERTVHKLERINTSEGTYPVSRRIYNLQRLFNQHVLREFDVSLLDDSYSNVNSIDSEWMGTIEYTIRPDMELPEFTEVSRKTMDLSSACIHHLTMFMAGCRIEEAFRTSIIGYKKRQARLGNVPPISDLLNEVTGLDEKSIMSAIQACEYDDWFFIKYRKSRRPSSPLEVESAVLSNLEFLDEFGPVTVPLVTNDEWGSRACDFTAFCTQDILWCASDNMHKLIAYWATGKYPVTKLGYFNPTARIINVEDLPETAIRLRLDYVGM